MSSTSDKDLHQSLILFSLLFAYLGNIIEAHKCQLRNSTEIELEPRNTYSEASVFFIFLPNSFLCPPVHVQANVHVEAKIM